MSEDEFVKKAVESEVSMRRRGLYPTHLIIGRAEQHAFDTFIEQHARIRCTPSDKTMFRGLEIERIDAPTYLKAATL